MSDSGPFKEMSEAELRPVLELLQGGNPDVIAENAGISKEKLFQMRDALLAEARKEQAATEQAQFPKVGRNDPCPCGSGKKYKRCCLGKHEEADLAVGAEEVAAARQKEKEEQRLLSSIEQTFNLFAGERYDEAIQAASRLLETYPDEDRLHDILASSHMHGGDSDEAVEVCRRRWEVAKEEKAYFIKHGRYRDGEAEKSLSYYYPPMTWVQKYWIALKSRDYRNSYPKDENPAIVELVKELQAADDRERFPEKYDKGYEIRRQALKKTVDRLKDLGPEALPYLLPLACRYCWTSLFVPELLFHYKTQSSIRSLIDVSMFGYAFSSGASLHYLEQLGEEAIPYIQEAFARDRMFDPIKTGVVAVLGNLRVPASYDFLMSLLEHPSHHIVNWAGGALGKFGKVEALPHLLAARERIGGEKMIDAAVQELESLQAPFC